MQLYAKINDREASYERVVLCQFTAENGDEVFMEEVEHHNEPCFKVVLDEGYVHTIYFYPIRRYTITKLEIYQ